MSVGVGSSTYSPGQTVVLRGGARKTMARRAVAGRDEWGEP